MKSHSCSRRNWMEGALLQIIVLAALIGCIGCQRSVPSASTRREDVDQFNQKLAAMEQRLSNLQLVVDGLQSIDRKVDVLQGQLDSLQRPPSGWFRVDSPDTYESLGPYWQVTQLRIESGPVGCRVIGEILYRLSVVRRNVSMQVKLAGIDASGSGLLMTAIPGRYAPFSITVPASRCALLNPDRKKHAAHPLC